ncbi:MAG: hypothetical protein ACREPN_04195 [Rudaea sp.]
MIDAFSYLSVLLSIIVGLAITQILQGFRGIVLSRTQVRMFWPVPVWAVSLLLINVQSWWAMFSLREVSGWTFAAFAVVLAQTIVQYLLAAIVFPDFPADRETDLREHYWAHTRWFFGLFILLLLISLAKSMILDGHLPEPKDLAFHLIFIALSVTALLTRRVWYHSFMALLGTGLFCAYVIELFTHLH